MLPHTARCCARGSVAEPFLRETHPGGGAETPFVPFFLFERCPISVRKWDIRKELTATQFDRRIKKKYHVGSPGFPRVYLSSTMVLNTPVHCMSKYITDRSVKVYDSLRQAVNDLAANEDTTLTRVISVVIRDRRLNWKGMLQHEKKNNPYHKIQHWKEILVHDLLPTDRFSHGGARKRSAAQQEAGAPPAGAKDDGVFIQQYPNEVAPCTKLNIRQHKTQPSHGEPLQVDSKPCVAPSDAQLLAARVRPFQSEEDTQYREAKRARITQSTVRPLPPAVVAVPEEPALAAEITAAAGERGLRAGLPGALRPARPPAPGRGTRLPRARGAVPQRPPPDDHGPDQARHRRERKRVDHRPCLCFPPRCGTDVFGAPWIDQCSLDR